VVEKLVSYMVEAPGEDADAKREFKYPYLACEIFCCEIDAVFATLAGPYALHPVDPSRLKAPGFIHHPLRV
jgi:hypothetical protein